MDSKPTLYELIATKRAWRANAIRSTAVLSVLASLLLGGLVQAQAAKAGEATPAAAQAPTEKPTKTAAPTAATPEQPAEAPPPADPAAATPADADATVETKVAGQSPRRHPLPGPAISPEAAADLEKQDTDCYPSCRSGHLCKAGQCISACNPACPEGYQCTPNRQCLPLGATIPSGQSAGNTQAPSYYPWPPVPPSDMNQPAPPDAWEPDFDEPYAYDHPLFVGSVGLQVGLGGVGSVRTGSDSDNDRKSEDFALDAGGGVEAQFEFRFHRHFGLAPGLRIFQVRAENAVETSTTLDLLVVPTFHLPLGQVELFLPVPVGLSFGKAPDDVIGGEGGGVTVGFTPGLIAWLSEQVGVYTQFGFNWHIRGYRSSGIDYVYRFRRPVLTVGLTFTD